MSKYTDEQVEFLIRAALTAFTGITSYVVQPPEVKLLINLTTVENILVNAGGILSLGLRGMGVDISSESIFKTDIGADLQFFDEEAHRSLVENDLKNPPEVDKDVWGDW